MAMRTPLPLRQMLAFALALGLALLLVLVLHLTDLSLSVWERLSNAPIGFWLVYGSLIAVVAGGGAWLVWRLLAPRRAGAALAVRAPVPLADEASVQARVQAAQAQGIDTHAVQAELAELTRRRAAGSIVVTFFGEVSSGKSSLIAALAPQAQVEISPVAGSTRSVSHHVWTSVAGDRLVLADVPGLNEADGTLDPLALAEAGRAHLVVFVCAGDLSRAEHAALERLLELGKPLLLVLNKSDRYGDADLALIEARLRERLAGRGECVVVTAGGEEEVLCIAADGSESRLLRPRPAQVGALAAAIEQTVDADPAMLESLRDAAVFTLLDHQLDSAVAAHRQARAEAIVQGYARKAVFGALAAVGPGTDVLIQGYLGVNMLQELCAVYEVPAKDLDLQRFLELASAHVGRKLNLLLALAGNVFKAFPGVGTVVGGALHAVAYGLIFESLGHAAARSLASRGALVPGVAITLLEDALGEHLETRARRLAGLVVGTRHADDSPR